MSVDKCEECRHEGNEDAESPCFYCVHLDRLDCFEPKEIDPVSHIYGVLYEGYTIPSQFHHSFNRLKSVNAGRSDYRVIRYVLDEAYYE